MSGDVKGVPLKGLAELPRAPLTVELVAFPLVISVRHDNRITVALLALLLLVTIARKSRSNERASLSPVGLLIVSAALVFWQGPFVVAALYILAALILVIAASTTTRESAYASLLAGLALYLVANLVGWIAGLDSPSSAVRVGEYEAGANLFGTRIFFPFALGINEPAWIATALICAVVAMVAIRVKPRWYLWVGSAVGIVVILGCNSRTPILLAIPLVFFLLAAPGFTRKLAPYGVGITMLLPFFMEQLQSVIRLAAGFVASNSFLGRGDNVEEIVGLSSRSSIWSHSIDYWGDHVTDTFHQLFGYGFLGHVTSGAAASYNANVVYLSDRSAFTMHNSVLQTMFDAGLVGAAILLGVVVFTVRRYGQNRALLPLQAVATMVSLSAALEVTLGPGLAQTPFFLLLYLAVFIPPKPSSSQPVKPAEPSDHERPQLPAEQR